MAKTTKPAPKPEPAPPAPAAKEPEAPKPEPKAKKAFTIERVPGGWTFVTFTYVTHGEVDKLVSVTRTEPDLKSITLETFKIAAFRYHTGGVE